MKLLSITVPSYNCEKTLKSTLESLCCQEVIKYLDIIVVDDGSTDKTASIAYDFEISHPESIRVISKENGGHGSAVNTGIINANGVYFRVVDGDDSLEKQGLLALIEKLKTTTADLVASNYKMVFVDTGIEKEKRFDNIKFNHLYDFSEIPSDGSVYFGIHSMNIKTSVLKNNYIKLQEHTFYVDTEFCLLPIPFVNTVEFIEDFVYLYSVGSSGQSIDTQNFVKRYEDHYRVVKRISEYVHACNTDKSHNDYMYAVLLKLCFTNYMLSVFYDNNVKRGKQRAREFDNWLKNSDERLYSSLNSSFYIRVMRLTRFVFLPRGAKMKSVIKKIYRLFKPHVKKKQRLTY